MQPPYKVELNNPKKTVLVEVMKATAAISVVEDYKMLGKLNLRELSMIGDDAVEAKPTSLKQPAEGAADGIKAASNEPEEKPKENAASAPQVADPLTAAAVDADTIDT